MSDDLISRQAAIDALVNHGKWLWERYHEPCHIAAMIDVIQDLPAAEVQEVKRGEWKEKHHSYSNEEQPIEEWQSARCSVCGKYHTTPYLYYFKEYAYCPSCGALLMDEVEE